jgi:YD repeat-containing protein
MNIRSGFLLVFGVVICLLAGGAYFLGSGPKPIIVASNSPPMLEKASVTSPASEVLSTAAGTASPESPAAPSSYQYNSQGQLQQILYGDGSTYIYRYDAHGDKISETDRAGKTWTYIYDQQQRPIRIINPAGHAENIEAGK